MYYDRKVAVSLAALEFCYPQRSVSSVMALYTNLFHLNILF